MEIPQLEDDDAQHEPIAFRRGHGMLGIILDSAAQIHVRGRTPQRVTAESRAHQPAEYPRERL